MQVFLFPLVDDFFFCGQLGILHQVELMGVFSSLIANMCIFI